MSNGIRKGGARLASLIQQSSQLDPQEGAKVSPKRTADALAVGLGLADLLAEKATQSATVGPAQEHANAIDYPTNPWGDTLETLSAAGLDANVYCARSGKFIYTLNADHFGTYLNALALYGDSPLGDQVQGQLAHAITTIKANTTLPQYMLTNATAHAHLRQSDPQSFLLLAIQDVLGRRADKNDELNAAEYVQDLNKARAFLNTHEKGVTTYVTECAMLFLRHIAPHTMNKRDRQNLLMHYKDKTISDILETEASLAHLCRRLLQTIFNYLSKYALRPIDTISTRDLATLRVHHVGVPIYKEMLAKENAMKAAKREKLRAERKDAQAYAQIERLEQAGVFDALDDDLFGVDGETFGLAVALNVGLEKNLSLTPDTPEQAEKFAAIRETARASAELDDIFSAGVFAMTDDDDEFKDLYELDAFPLTDDAQQLASAGYLDIEEVSEFDAFIDNFQTPDEPDASHEQDDYNDNGLTKTLMEQSKPIPLSLSSERRLLNPSTPSTSTSTSTSTPAPTALRISKPAAHTPPTSPTPKPAPAPAVKHGFALSLKRPTK